MACNMLDSSLYRNSFSTPVMREIFDDKSIMQNILDIEAALAATQGEMGLIPKEAAEEICRKAKAENLDFARVEAGINKVGHSLVPILREFQTVCEGNLGEYVHMGATTQDIIDTAFMLAMKRGVEVIYKDMLETEVLLCNTAEKYRDTIMPGRSHTQQALPITFGYKVAVWASEHRRNIERLEECMKRCFVGEMAGAVGTMAGFGPDGLEVCRGVIIWIFLMRDAGFRDLLQDLFRCLLDQIRLNVCRRLLLEGDRDLGRGRIAAEICCSIDDRVFACRVYVHCGVID